MAGERLVGMISIAGRDEGVASDDNVAVATEVATQLAVAIEHATARERLERSYTRLSLVHDIDRAILAAATPRQIAESVAEPLLALLSARPRSGSRPTRAQAARCSRSRASTPTGSGSRCGIAGPGRPAPATLVANRDVLVFERLEDALEVMPSARISIDARADRGLDRPAGGRRRRRGLVALAGGTGG